jgi:hypothetical protein
MESKSPYPMEKAMNPNDPLSKPFPCFAIMSDVKSIIKTGAAIIVDAQTLKR